MKGRHQFLCSYFLPLSNKSLLLNQNRKFDVRVPGCRAEEIIGGRNYLKRIIKDTATFKQPYDLKENLNCQAYILYIHIFNSFSHCTSWLTVT